MADRSEVLSVKWPPPRRYSVEPLPDITPLEAVWVSLIYTQMASAQFNVDAETTLTNAEQRCPGVSRHFKELAGG